MAPINPPAPPPDRPRMTGAGKHFARFELRRLLGKSDRAMVWLVFDPRTQQELMLTLPRVACADDGALARWQRDARLALRPDHPRLAGGVEVGVHERWPYLAVDRACGITVPEWLEQHPRPLPPVVAGWVVQALEGLAFAHEAGITHGDLQLHNLLIDEEGAVSVMALATAGEPRTLSDDGLTTVHAHHEQLRDRRQVALRDVLSIGLLMHRLLAAQVPLDEPDTARAIERMTPEGREVVRLPWDTPTPVPEALRVIANRATANQERQRYLSARTMLRALAGWVETEGQDRGGPLALLIDRLRTVGHLPAMPGVTARVERLAQREGQHTEAIAEEILQDMALSFELLRAVNAAQLRQAVVSELADGTPVLTIRRCVALIGLDGVRAAARGLRRWPGPLSEASAAAMDKAVQLVRLAGLAAQRLRPAGYDPEVVYLVTLLQNLGRLLVQYHFPDEAAQIRQLMQPAPGQPAAHPAHAEQPAAPGMTEAVASVAVLGVDLDALGAAVVRHWALGDEVQLMARRLPLDRPVLAPDGDLDLLRLTASAANEAVDAMATPGTPQRKLLAIGKVAQRYGRVLHVGPGELQQALQDARADLQRGPAASGAAAAPGRAAAPTAA